MEKKKIALYLKIGIIGDFSLGNVWTLCGHLLLLDKAS